MPMQALIKSLNAQGISVFLDNGALKSKSASNQYSKDVVAKIKGNKAQLIAFLSESQQRNAAIGQSEIPRSDKTQLGLSFAQRRLWFIDQLEGASPQYNMPITLLLSGPLNVAYLQQAFGRIIERHQILRTVYRKVNGEGVQLVQAHDELPVRQVDLRSTAEQNRKAAAIELIDQAVSIPFDLANDLMLRCLLVRMADDQHVLVLSMHHIACDGWSQGILVTEFSSYYRAACEQRISQPAPLAIQYKDFADWQSGNHQTQLERQCDYWCKQLAEINQLHSLPLDKPRPAQQQFDGQIYNQTIDKTTMDGLQALAQAHGATVFMVLEAAFALLIGRRSAQDNVVVGTPVAGRTQSQLEPLIGFFVNTLVINTQLNPAHSFIDLLAQTRSTTLAAFDNQDVPFEMLVEALKPQRSLSYSPLFQILFALQNNDYGQATLPNLEVSSFASDKLVNRFDLEVFAHEGEAGLNVGWNYATALFERSSIVSLADSYATLLTGIVAAPKTPIYQLPMTTTRDIIQLREWQRRDNHYEVDFTVGVHHRVEQIARQNPDDIAVVDNHTSLSYAQLNQQANQLAHALLGEGVQLGDLVGVSVERSVMMIVSVLAVLKAGAAYVALDPNYPKYRLDYICRDSGLKRLIGDNSQQWPDAVSLLSVNDWPYQNQPATNPNVDVCGNDLAYVIYTSGSTGQPKGVTLPHKVLSNLVVSQYRRYPEMADKLPTLQYSTLNFDMAIYEIMTALCSGSPLVVASEQQRLALSQLVDLINTHQIGCLYLPTAMLLNFCEYVIDSNRNVASLSMLQVAGEALTIYPQVRAFFSAHQNCRLLNCYGPSETHVVTDLVLEGDPQQWPVLPTIGKPIANAKAYVFDPYRNDLPIGSVGELYIGGPCLASAYLNQPQMTAERFIAHPQRPDERLYRTGDLVRFLADGTLDYLGRADSQVKIRGYRIELAEIEQQLLLCDGVKAAVVLALELNGSLQLVAYVTVVEAATGAEVISAQLGQTLPDYMLPSSIIVMDEFALTGNGKVDKKALPKPTISAQDDQPYRAPSSETEQALHDLWCEYLQLQPAQLCCDRGFFTLGGHSLLAMRLCNGIFKQLAVDVPVRMLFVHDTVALLARFIDDTQAQPTLPELIRIDGDQPLPLSFAQQRLWFINQLNGASSQYNLPSAVELTGKLNAAALQLALNQLVSRHQVLRTTFVNVDGQGRQQVNPVSPVAINVIDLTGVAVEQQEQKVLAIFSEDLNKSFDLANDLMLRATLMQLAPQRHVLLLNMHHIASDGWSMAVVAQELSHFYNNHSTELPELPVQYGDYSVWQKACLAGERLLQQQAYWQTNLAGLPQLHNLPLDKTRPAKPDYLGRSYIHRFDANLTAKLNKLAQQHDVTLFMLLQSVYALTLSRWSNETDIVIGSPMAGRNHHDLEGLIGFFVNTLLLRHQLDDNRSFADLLAQTKTTTLAAFAHQDVPFEMLVELLKPQRSVSHSPLFQVMFVMQNNQQADWQLDGLTVNPIGGEAQLIKHDLNLSVIEQPDGLAFYWNYATALFDMDTIERMSESFCAIVEQVSVLPHQPLRQVSMLSDRQSQLLQSWNQTAKDYELEGTLHQMIGATIKKVMQSKPQAIALKQADFVINYQQLDTLSQRIAGHLMANGIGRGARVGLYTQRHPVFVIGLLGILRAGACYVPIDISSTPARLESIVDDAQISMMLSQQSLLGNITVNGVNTLVLDECRESDWLESANSNYDDCTLPAGHCSDTAYICYTSGSTGKPKGVEVAHRGVIDYCQNALQAYYDKSDHEQGGLQGALLVTSPAFDITVPAIYLPLLRGDCIELMPQEQGLEAFAQHLDNVDCGNQLIRMTPMHGEALVALLAGDFVAPQAHCFVIGGESFPVALAKQLAAKFPNSQIYNHYGPTEAVVGCAMFDVTGNLADLAQGDGQIPIGKAMANTELFVLDHNAQPVPLGVVGELYVGGECVTKGYINRAALSFEKFVELTLPGAVYQRFYRTGDQVKYDAQGNLWFVGRVDNQVKLRGFRIELGEIEQQINEVAGVEKALVQVTGEGAQKQLLAFIRANAGGPLSPLLLANVHAQLDKYLPAYMKPDHFVALDDVPLSANGKADYKALVASFVAPQQTPVLPVTSTEKKLRSLWAEVLQRDEQSLSVQDSFFSVGGHSLLIIKLFSQIRQHWGEVISVNQLYQYPTIAAQAGYLVIADTLAEAGQLVTLREGNNNGLFIIHPIGGDVSCYGSLTQQLDTDMTVYGLQHAAFVKGQNVELTTIEIMAESYLQQIKSAQANGPYHLLGWSFGGLVALFVARLLESQGETVSYLGLIDSVVQQDQQGWASFEQSYQQENGHGEPSIESYHDFVQSQPQLLADFDRAYQVEALAMQMNGSQSTIRQVVISNLVVAKAINTDFNTNKLHYYGAAQTQSQSGPDNLVTLGQISDVPMTVHTVSADHFTIMQYPQVNLLAQYIDADLLLTSSASEISKTRGTNGK